MSGLRDQPARDTVTTELGATLFVEAGAGSGKTTSLVERIVSLVASGVPVDQIAAITFTEAAASELRVRVRDALDVAGRRRADPRLVAAAARVETAAFTTLHGFALRLLSDHPVEAGLPPGFGVVDEIGSILAFDRAWRAFAGRIGDDLELLELQSRAAVLSLELRRFPDVARRFDDNWDLLDGINRTPPALRPLDFSPLIEQLATVVGLADDCDDPDDTLAKQLVELGDRVRFLAEIEPIDQLELLTHLPWPKGRSGRKGNWTTISVDDARATVSAARNDVDAALAEVRHEVIDHMTALVAGFVEVRVEARQSSGELAFHDLLVLSRRLLRSNERVRDRLHQRYRRILLDEFQDTDPIQIELAVLLASSEPVVGTPWHELATRLEPGRLVVVGDPKQSIYRFRRADIAVYADAEEHLVPEATRLTTNFRSVAGIVEWVNHVFSAQIGAGEPGAQPTYTALDPARGRRLDGSPEVLVMGEEHDASVNVASLRELEARDVAAVACRAIEEGWLVERNGQWQPARLSDIAVLIPSRLSLPALESAFAAANVPFRPETSSLVYATQEVRDLLAGIRAVADPSNSVDVVAALRSALFAIGDDDLLSWKLADGRWDYRDPAADGLDGRPVDVAFASLRAWHDRRWWTEPAALIEAIVVERRLREQALAWPRPRDHWRRLRFLSEQARQFSATQGGDLLDFVAWVDIQSSDLARVTEPIPPEPDDDAVRVLTVHGSKGLEFPIVVLAGAPTVDGGGRAGAKVLFPRDGGRPEVALAKDRASANFEIRASVEDVLDRYERIRLHYVAATRARDRLIVSAHHKAGRSSIGLRTWESIQDCTHLWDRFVRRGDERYDAAPPTQLRLAGDSFGDEAATFAATQEAILAAAAGAGSRSATALASAITGVADDADADIGDDEREERQPWRRGRAGTAIGSAVHAVLQHIDLESGERLDELVALHAGREGVAHVADQIQAMVRSALAAPTVVQAASSRHWRELSVALPGAGAGVIEGYVDLVVDSPDGLIVIDFKTDHAPDDAAIDRLLHRYQYQGATYAIALEHITGRPVADCRFLFIGVDGVVERSVPDLPAVMARVRTEIHGDGER